MAEQDNKGKRVNSYVKYSAMGFQMLVTIGLFVFAGYKIDAYQQNRTPLATALLGVLGVIVSLYQVIRQLNRKE
ncbi:MULTISPECIES: AtpZ/AtpI family protein [Pedobacter]|uniref:AtpZ/AtpI family protein n=1 Tax=Pedobacter TaxID=84567 RepID=UPI00210E67CF|nr:MULTISPECIES: AtpZ/AtpI family protein [unclassified Pedobacter]